MPKRLLKVPKGVLKVPKGVLKVPKRVLEVPKGAPKVLKRALKVPKGALKRAYSGQPPYLSCPEGKWQIKKFYNLDPWFMSCPWSKAFSNWIVWNVFFWLFQSPIFQLFFHFSWILKKSFKCRISKACFLCQFLLFCATEKERNKPYMQPQKFPILNGFVLVWETIFQEI